MASLITGYEYDIFISYRHNDNRSGWVTDFVTALQEELASTIKEPLTIYFDKNPHDGLLETHNVDKSLEGKLKCLIFIPIISQTYCDPKSFAWQHEFCAFNNLTKEDSLGGDIKLSNGNVASRILPIKIHDLDAEDKAVIENEIGGVLRAIEFIYKEAGVNRPLRLNEDNPNKNQNQTTYRNQVNKVANAIKDITVGVKHTGAGAKENRNTKPTPVSPSFRKKTALVASVLIILGIAFAWFYYRAGWGETLASTQAKSIAVLPFENMNHDPEQDYFSSGMSEDILNHLVKIADLRVKSRTSTLQYKGTTKTAPQIGEELNVANIVEGSVRRVGDQVRIVVQLIDAENDVHLWSETYDRDFKDVLSLQSEIAMEIARALEARLTAREKINIEKEATQNVTAYDYFLKAQEFARRGTGKKADLEIALQLLNKAIQNDKNFARAYVMKGWMWFNLSSFGVPEKVWYDSVMLSADQAIRLDPAAPDAYLMKGNAFWFVGKIKEWNALVKKAYSLAPNNPEVMGAYGWQMLEEGKEEGADLMLKSAEMEFSSKDPNSYNAYIGAYFVTNNWEMVEQLCNQQKMLNPESIGPFNTLASAYNWQGKYDKAIEELKAAEKINPNRHWLIDRMAWTYFRKKDFEAAAKYWGQYPEIESSFSDTTQRVPFRHRLAMTYAKLGRRKEGERLVHEDLQIQTEILSKKRGMGAWDNFGSIYYDLAVDHAFLGNNDLAVQCLDSALHYEFYMDPGGYGNDPMFESLKNREDFKGLAKKQSDYFLFRKQAFSNALNRAQASTDLKGLLK
jgi:TolB-like protein/lipopolysaccharide biosynthesis regulator YciM